MDLSVMMKRYKTALIIFALLALGISDLATSDEKPISGLLHAKGMAAILLAVICGIILVAGPNRTHRK